MHKCLYAVVYGHVQGVGFRYFVKTIAESLHLSGWVRNLADGTVEVNASGPANELEQFLLYLSNGSTGSRVEKVVSQWGEETPRYRGFEIKG